MAEIKNKSPGIRIFNVKAGDGQTQYMLNPGESVSTDDVELFDPLNPVYAGWHASGDVEFPEGMLKAPEVGSSDLKGRRVRAPAQPISPTPNVGGPGGPLTPDGPAPKPGG